MPHIVVQYDTSPASDVPAWKLRETLRMQGQKAAPWNNEPWAARHADHFVHLSQSHPGLLAYTQNVGKGERDIQTPIKPGTYLNKYYSDILTPEQITDWVAKCRKNDNTLQFTTDSELIRTIYTHISACMSHDPGHYSSAVHPLTLYQDTGLSLAYVVKDGRDRSKYIGRAWVHPERRIYSRIYGDHKLLHELLQSAGYVQGLLEGVVFKALCPYEKNKSPKYPTLSSNLCCPFVDHIKWARFNPEEGTLTLQSAVVGATHSVQHTNGRAYPIHNAPYRPYGLGSVQADWIESVESETGTKPTHYPNGSPTNPEAATAIPPPTMPLPVARRAPPSWASGILHDSVIIDEMANVSRSILEEMYADVTRRRSPLPEPTPPPTRSPAEVARQLDAYRFIAPNYYIGGTLA